MPALLALLLPALLPILGDGVRSAFNFFTGGAGAQPANVDEAVKLMAAETEKLKALAELDRPAANISPWVSDLRGSFRYIAAGLIIVGGLFGVGAVVLGKADPNTIDFVNGYLQGIVAPVFSFMFGQHMYLSLKSAKR